MLVHARPPVARAIFLSGQVGYHAYPKIIRLDTTLMAAPDKPTPTEIKLHQTSRLLEIAFADGKTFSLTCEFLRVNTWRRLIQRVRSKKQSGAHRWNGFGEAGWRSIARPINANIRFHHTPKC